MANILFSNYVIRLHHDPDELERFKKDPDARIGLAGLSKEQGEALKSRDVRKIHEALCAEAGVPDTSSWECNRVNMAVLADELRG